MLQGYLVKVSGDVVHSAGGTGIGVFDFTSPRIQVLDPACASICLICSTYDQRSDNEGSRD